MCGFHVCNSLWQRIRGIIGQSFLLRNGHKIEKKKKKTPENFKVGASVVLLWYLVIFDIFSLSLEKTEPTVNASY